MTLEDLEHGIELHEKRLGRIEENLVVQGERLGRLGEIMERNEQRLAGVEDNLVVQGEFLNRLDQRFDRVAAMMEDSERQRGEDRERLRTMQAAMTSLFQRMDAFIRGLERGNGHPKPGTE